MSTLLDIRADFDALEDLLFEIGGDVTDEEVSAAIDAWLAENRENLKDKLDGYGVKIREFELRGKARKEEADRIAALAQADLNAAKRLKDRLRWFFEAEGVEKLETDRFRFSLANNGGKAPLLVHCDPDKLPDWAKRITVAADIEAIRGEIEAGGEVDFAEIGERGKHLRIR